MTNAVATIQSLIRDIPDFPKPGILFKDITPLLGDPAAFHQTIELMAAPFLQSGIQKVVSVEARGFILGAPLAYRLGAGVVPVRKPNKLPFQRLKAEYALEYGTDSLEMHTDAIAPGTRCLIVDDVLATGGTVSGVLDLVRQLKGEVVGLSFLIELGFLQGRQKLPSENIVSLLQY